MLITDAAVDLADLVTSRRDLGEVPSEFLQPKAHPAFHRSGRTPGGTGWPRSRRTTSRQSTPGQHQVEHDQIGPVAIRAGERLIAVVGNPGLVSGPF
jgi:hypothetical protein